MDRLITMGENGRIKDKIINHKINMAPVKSPLRYPGGKSRAIDKIIPHIPTHINEYPVKVGK